MSGENIDYDKLVKDHLRLRLIESGWNDQLNELIQNAVIKRIENGQSANSIKFEQLYNDVVDFARDAITEELENEFHQKIDEYLSLNSCKESNSSIPSPNSLCGSSDIHMEVSPSILSNVTSNIPSDCPSDIITNDDSFMDTECSYNH
ncbi:uncharacterized protein LOC112680952 [Sipha flava]|uniref:Uncharacterized protein LOC112680952 n=1 Tax=Sipha flava TaxID=143950 RepID=A0A2S2PY07_9HEMI|nr:uncharacterized protein LOC112680952 [Sipha flava]XP_025406975.1 uncharacterized protein LOC112680952 [Sipha flava]XP_025406976.1 uncharacterized protein LOC112680952 [Sipha flava]XP_025406977.1 uncharacterized protein LOC112680952 [Sipha flava]XP_025406978.1 uncharacterized protein LOC112680952 [Sipha flava]XP_025406980.1 uncharacterized protein LOC112680952 [Sipha flava]